MGIVPYPAEEGLQLFSATNNTITIFYVGTMMNTFRLVFRLKNFHEENCISDPDSYSLNIDFIDNSNIYKNISASSNGSCIFSLVLPKILPESTEYGTSIILNAITYDGPETVTVVSTIEDSTLFTGSYGSRFSMFTTKLFEFNRENAYMWVNTAVFGDLISMIIPPGGNLTLIYYGEYYMADRNLTYTDNTVGMLMSTGFPDTSKAPSNIYNQLLAYSDSISLTITVVLADLCTPGVLLQIFKDSKIVQALNTEIIRNQTITITNASNVTIVFTNPNETPQNWYGYLILYQTRNVNVTMDPNTTPKTKYGLIIGLSIGGSIISIIAIGLIFLLVLKKRQKRFDKMYQILQDMNISNKDIDSYKTTMDVYKIPSENLHINFDAILGTGVTSTVYKGRIIGQSPLYVMMKSMETRKFIDCDVAVKISNNFGENEVTYLLQEIQAMKTIEYHENIMCMLGWTMTGENPCLIFDIAKEDLLNFVTKFRDSNIEEVPYRIFISILWQVTRGMQYIRSKGLIHRDLAARNILLFDNNTAKISDFGLCCTGNDHLYYQASLSKKLPLKWLSLEAILDRKFSEKSDVWSFGVLAYEVFAFGVVPYATMDNDEMLEFLKSGKRLNRPEGTQDEIYSLLLSCWKEKPDDRPNFGELNEKLYKFMVENYGSEDYVI